MSYLVFASTRQHAKSVSAFTLVCMRQYQHVIHLATLSKLAHVPGHRIAAHPCRYTRRCAQHLCVWCVCVCVRMLAAHEPAVRALTCHPPFHG